MATAGKPVDSVEARLARAEAITGHVFADRALLQQAITHPSASEDRDPSAYYERLEFLGDAVVGMLVAEEVYRRFPEMDEGGMTRIRVSVVAGTVLASVASRLGLADVLILGHSEVGTAGRGLTSALENSFEALTAALYVDDGIETARAWVLDSLGPLISSDAAHTPENPKSRLQELLQADGVAPLYRITRTDGPPHDRSFVAIVEVAGTVRGSGSGRSKKDAEAAAAADALRAMDPDLTP
ncbi:MAG: ribonuclease III [Coriobacteriia bacterium]|nr:ribonuclease III [Coriobacteriia bacterium]